jgi:hypothetical protein
MSGSDRRWTGRSSRLLVACVVLLASYDGARADDRAEIEALKQQIQELKRSDEAKQRQLDEMMQLLRQIAPQAVAQKKAASPARPSKVAAEKPPPTEQDRSRAALDQAVQEIGGPDASAPSSGPASALATTPTSAPVTQADSGSGDLGTPGSTAVPGTLLYRPLPGKATLRLLEPSFDVLVAGGWSTADDAELKTLQGGAHDPDRRGFTLQQAELSMFGAVDPYFNAETHIVFVPDGVELEEAFGTTQQLPYGLQAKAGYYLTEFGRMNPTHPHAWAWIDQPIVNTRMFGGDGLRSTGVQMSWLLPLPLFSEIYAGVQNANEDEFTTSFLAPEAVGNRPAVRTDTRNFGDLLYLARWATAWNMSDTASALLGFSGLFGPNSTGGPARTFIYGTDFTLKWRPADNFRGWPFLLWQSEAIKRDYTAEPFTGSTTDTSTAVRGRGTPSITTPLDGFAAADTGQATGDIPGALLRDWGFYTQLLYGFEYEWAAGARFEWDSGDGPSVGGRANDPLRDDRFRFSPLLQYQPSEFSRLRLQYNFDHATALPGNGDANTVWLGLELLFGTHPAHKW